MKVAIIIVLALTSDGDRAAIALSEAEDRAMRGYVDSGGFLRAQVGHP
jgi:hypothetical protein